MVNICAGLDLSGSERKSSGVSIVEVGKGLDIKVLYVGRLRSNSEITELLLKHYVRAVAVDSPLTLPSRGKHFREVDLKLVKMGYRVLPPSWASMKKLTVRAINLVKELKSLGILVIETHPTSSLRSSGCDSFDELAGKLHLELSRELSKDEKDAVIAAVTCAFHLLNKDIVVKDEDGEIAILPRICVE
jgi:predicted nuclease with RNAse H fold